MVLERAGFSALVAEDGQEALRIASEHPDGIDLLVSDVQMPGMGGPDLAMVLRRYGPELRILLVSADPQRG
jgi:two-component system, cell cycle sensor histidine kinase and response regulator CckA